MKTALMVAEKPSLALSLAQILSDKRCNTRKVNSASSVHEWTGYFKNESIKFKMTSVCGHVFSLDFHGKYNNWDNVDPSELFTCPVEKKEASPNLRIPQFLAQEAKGCDYIILWLDCDKEGENICFEVLNCIQRSVKFDFRNAKFVFRAKFSAITENDIKSAMNKLESPNENEAKSVDARQELDLRIGCAFTRFQTKFFQGRYGDLDSTLISYGPCQTPTLGFCVQRHDDIQSFKPESFWYAKLQLESIDMQLSWSRGNIFDKTVATLLVSMLSAHEVASVVSIDSKELVKQRPLALNTVELMKAASAGLGLGPHTVMHIAEKLYTQGYISYPRTETTHYHDTFNTTEVLNLLSLSHEYKSVATNAKIMNQKPRRGHDAGDHPPITPLKNASRADFSDNDSWRVYDYICRHFIASLSQDLLYKCITYNVLLGDENFYCSCNSLIRAGFTEAMPWLSFGQNDNNLNLSIGDKLAVKNLQLVESQTSPPDYLTESELISLMEKHGIGTDASIPVHINNICQRNYVSIASGRKLIPTTLGVVLVHGYQRVDNELVLPTMRSAVEEQLNLIAQGNANFNAVLKHAIKIFQQKFNYFVANINLIDQLFELSFSPLAESGKKHSRCGKCRRYMNYIQAAPSRLYCSFCGETYSLPPGGILRVYKELKCPLDDFELLSYSTGVMGRSFPLCPYCYNNPPFSNMSRGCNSCTHPTCTHGLLNNGIAKCSDCSESGRGILVLDPSSGPKWKIGCNACDVVINIFEDAQKVIVEQTECDECGSQLVSVSYKSEKSKFKNTSEMTACIFCSEHFSPLVKKHYAVKSKSVLASGKVFPNRRGGGRGRVKPRQPKDKMSQLAAYFV